MNKYISFEIDGDWFQFRTLARDWIAIDSQPATVRPTLLGTSDVTFAPVALKEWRGSIEVPVTPDGTDWGGITEFRSLMALAASVQFKDHSGTQYTVAVVGNEFVWKSFKNVWDAASNKFHIPIRVVKTG